MYPQMIEREQLSNAIIGTRNLTSVDVRRNTLVAGLHAGRDLHPCAVVGFIASGTAVMQIEGEPEQILATGAAFYEPASTVIADFGNALATKPMPFIAFYLLDGEQDPITMLESQ